MKKVIRLTESDLTRIVNRVINEQNEIDKFKSLTKKGYVESEIPRNLSNIVNKLISRFGLGDIKYFTRKSDSSVLISDGTKVIFLSLPTSSQYEITKEYKLLEIINQL